MKKKYKVIKKVKEHHKKKAKEAKKLGLGKRKVEKDPGIPNDWPFKEQELKALEERRARAVEEIEQKKAARKERVYSSSFFREIAFFLLLRLAYSLLIEDKFGIGPIKLRVLHCEL